MRLICGASRVRWRLLCPLTDFDEESVLSVRYTKVKLPAGVRKVFLSNEAAIWPASDAAIGAIARRVTTIHTPNKLY